MSNPISIREAFWAPYKKVIKIVEDQVTKSAAKADEEANAKLADGAKTTAAEVSEEATKSEDAAPPPPLARCRGCARRTPEKKFDLSTVALIGVAIGGIGTLFGTLFGVLFGLGIWMPIGVVALLLMISGPSMLLAWLKLRRRNLGPLLDANGWAINSRRAKINVPFGATMTGLPELPERLAAIGVRSVRGQDAAMEDVRDHRAHPRSSASRGTSRQARSLGADEGEVDDRARRVRAARWEEKVEQDRVAAEKKAAADKDAADKKAAADKDAADKKAAADKDAADKKAAADKAARRTKVNRGDRAEAVGGYPFSTRRAA